MLENPLTCVRMNSSQMPNEQRRKRKDKPLKAIRFVKSIDREQEVPDCLKWLDDIVGKQEILHNMDYHRKLK